MLRYLTAGESHGPGLVGILEGLPAGLSLDFEAIDRELTRRQGGFGRGGRQKIETDRVQFLGGVRQGVTLGSPIALLVKNRDYELNWRDVMSPEPGGDPAKRRLTRPRPGHADLAGALKYDFSDVRNVLERASARETAARVAVGAICQQLCEAAGLSFASHVVEIGGEAADTAGLEVDAIRERAAASPVYCADSGAEARMIERIRWAQRNGDSLGGVFEVIVTGVPAGLGSHVFHDRRLDGRLGGALLSIQGIKGVEVGLGFAAARRTGSQVHDEIFHDPGRGYYRETNRAGGIEGGISNGMPIVVRAAMKPIPTLYKPLRSVDMETKESFEASIERSDVCSVPAVSVVGQAAVAFVLAQALLEKCGGDSLGEFLGHLEAYRRQVAGR